MVTRSILRPVLRPVTRAVSDTIRGFNPRSLFAAGEQGALYDLYDQSTLFQDAAGTTPWTTLGQPLGLQRDKSKGLVRSANLVTNGDFSSATGWTAGAGWAIGSGVATATASSADLSTDIGAVATRWHVVTFTVTRTAGSLTVIASGTATTTPTISASGTYTLYILASGAGSTLIFRGSGFSGTIDNVSAVYEQGNHRYQTTPASRPTIEALVNLQLNSALWSSILTSSDGTSTASESTDVPANSGVFTSSLRIIKNGDLPYFYGYTIGAGAPVANNVVNTRSFFIKPSANVAQFGCGTSPADRFYFRYTVATGAITVGTNAQSAAVAAIGNGWYRAQVTQKTLYADTTAIFVVVAVPTVTASAASFDVIGLQTEAGASATTYQRVTTATDYADVGAPRRIKYDGIDDFLQTASVDFSATDKMTVWAGVRKLSDAVIGVVVELSTNSDSTNGTFALAASVGGSGYYAQSRGTVRPTINATGYVAPHSAVLVAEAKISTDILRLHVNNAAPLSSATDQGTGNYGNYPLYFGRRAGTSLPFSGEVFSPEVIRGAASTAAQIDMVERVINRNMGGVY